MCSRLVAGPNGCALAAGAPTRFIGRTQGFDGTRGSFGGRTVPRLYIQACCSAEAIREARYTCPAAVSLCWCWSTGVGTTPSTTGACDSSPLKTAEVRAVAGSL